MRKILIPFPSTVKSMHESNLVGYLHKWDVIGFCYEVLGKVDMFVKENSNWSSLVHVSYWANS